MKRLENKVAVIYGGGTGGGAVAKAFARAVTGTILNLTAGMIVH